MIGVGSVGVDMVDVEAATAAGIVVTNVPDVFIEEVADHAMMLLLDVARRTADDGADGARRRVVPGASDPPPHPAPARPDARPLRVRQRRALHRKARPGVRPAGASPTTPTSASWRSPRPASSRSGFDELLERSDYLSVHAPHNEETEHAIDAAACARMKPTAVVINTARGPIIDEAALIEALQNGDIAGAGLDVLEQEPPSNNNPLLTMENVVVTPHVASATTRMRPETRRRVGREVALVLRGRWPMSCVNPTVLPRVALERWQPYPMNRGPNRLESEETSVKVVQAIAKAMKAEGVDVLFAYPVNPLIEAAAAEDIRTVIVRQERVGLHMADAYSRMSSGDKIGVFCMQHGPGAENAFGGVAQAFSESVADPGDPGRLSAAARGLLPELQLRPEHAPHHQVGRAADHGPHGAARCCAAPSSSCATAAAARC